MFKLVGNSLGQLLLVMTALASVHAAAPFYEGKTIRLIVGFSAGGGFDTYSRLIARHLGRHIPGNPAIVVEIGNSSTVTVRCVPPPGLVRGSWAVSG